MLFILGLVASAGLHGLYDWMVGRSFLGAATVVWLTFVLFYTLTARPKIFLTDGSEESDTEKFAERQSGCCETRL